MQFLEFMQSGDNIVVGCGMVKESQSSCSVYTTAHGCACENLHYIVRKRKKAISKATATEDHNIKNNKNQSSCK
jgi:hypothetical protein